jgi:hypothetical protein
MPLPVLQLAVEGVGQHQHAVVQVEVGYLEQGDQRITITITFTTKYFITKILLYKYTTVQLLYCCVQNKTIQLLYCCAQFPTSHFAATIQDKGNKDK